MNHGDTHPPTHLLALSKSSFTYFNIEASQFYLIDTTVPQPSVAQLLRGKNFGFRKICI